MLTPERAAILAAYAKDRRDWDKAGCMAVLKRVSHLDADRVALAWVRFCADPKAATPGAFPRFSGPHWQEKVRDGADALPAAPRRDQACPRCSRFRELCICGDDERPQEALGGLWRPTEPAPPERVSEYADQARAAMRRDA